MPKKISKNNFITQRSSFIVQKGYTLIEIMVAITLFFIVIAGPTSFFVYSVRSQQKALAYQNILDNVSYVLEYMSRAIRMAEKDDIDIGGGAIDCLSGNKVNYEVALSGQEIKFRNYKDECQRFYLDSGQIKQDKDGEILPLTPNDLEITSIKFVVLGETQEDSIQPKVNVFLNIKSNSPASEPRPEIKIQTTVSQRNLDVVY